MAKVIRKVMFVKSFGKDEKLLKKVKNMGYNPELIWSVPSGDNTETVYFNDKGRSVHLKVNKKGEITLVSDMAEEDARFLRKIQGG